jgi:voltage-gated potassium channel
VTAIVILVSSQLLFITGAYDDYIDALYEAALVSISGIPLSPDTGFSRLLDVVLSIYSVAVFATLAGALGAFFLRGQDLEPDGVTATATPTISPDADAL